MKTRLLARLVLVLAGSTVLGAVVIPALIIMSVLGTLPAREIVPPPQYTLWWTAAQLCSRTLPHRPYPRFYVVPGESFPFLQWQVVGLYDAFQNRIYLADGQQNDWDTVSHEMLHALGHRHGDLSFYVCGVE